MAELHHRVGLVHFLAGKARRTLGAKRLPCRLHDAAVLDHIPCNIQQPEDDPLGVRPGKLVEVPADPLAVDKPRDISTGQLGQFRYGWFMCQAAGVRPAKGKSHSLHPD